jgi:hypothetical protein
VIPAEEKKRERYEELGEGERDLRNEERERE